jgi:hypothetical protein
VRVCVLRIHAFHKELGVQIVHVAGVLGCEESCEMSGAG